MYTQLQRFIATILLFSLLLQSCGNPNWKMVDGPGPKPSAKESRPVKVRQTKATKPTQEQAISLERSIEPRSLPSSEYATDALVKLSSEVPPAVDRKSPSTPSFAPVRATTQRTLSGSSPRSAATTPKAAIKHHANKPRHAVLGQDIIVHRKGAPLATSRTISPVVVAIPVTQPQALPPTSSLHAEKLHPVFSRQPQPKVQHALKSTERKESAVGKNLSLGVIPRGHVSHPAFLYGQRFGDGLSMCLGVAELLSGGGMRGKGGGNGNEWCCCS